MVPSVSVLPAPLKLTVSGVLPEVTSAVTAASGGMLPAGDCALMASVAVAVPPSSSDTRSTAL
jgi:hypothetical protein